jgi:ferritin
MLSKKIEQTLNDQLNFEIFSANIYMSMAAYFDSLNLKGFANWMKIQYQEEILHMTKFYDFINERGGRVVISAMESPPTKWDSPLAAFEHALSHERIVSGRIDDMMTLATDQKDHASVNFLQWFVGEQVEEESSVDAVVQQLKLIGDAPGAMFMLDRELGARIFTPPAAEAQAQ